MSNNSLNKRLFVDLTVDDDDKKHPAVKRSTHGGFVNLCDDDESVEALERTATSDYKLAVKLSEKWKRMDRGCHNNGTNSLNRSNEWAERAMVNSIPGKAVVIVQKIIKIVNETLREFPQFKGSIKTIGTDDMVYLAEKLLQTQRSFASLGIPSHADIGYHYTQPTCLDSIRENGLLSKAERDVRGVHVHYNGSALGDGIYTANNPFFAMGNVYGDAGLLVVRIIGNFVPALGMNNGHTYSNSPRDPTHAWAVHVLKTSGQCLPMVKFEASKVFGVLPNSVLTRPAGFEIVKGRKDVRVACVLQLHERLQKAVDEFLNNGRPTSFTIHNLGGQVIHSVQGAPLPS